MVWCPECFVDRVGARLPIEEQAVHGTSHVAAHWRAFPRTVKRQPSGVAYQHAESLLGRQKVRRDLDLIGR